MLSFHLKLDIYHITRLFFSMHVAEHICSYVTTCG